MKHVMELEKWDSASRRSVHNVSHYINFETCKSQFLSCAASTKEPDGGAMKGLAFAYDPDGYAIEIIKRGGIEFGDKRVTSS